ncbi:phenylalanine--tRNA ligase subunit beta [Mycoplasma sp. Pen4]|uniref:phenylalanine--tRNA ligase subunit beta n=1 Tax=Mycoplasma sp. Pen4 TaxID=640330 RepID=UPI00165413B9|nr:phenylalanine--tRNA ligase subunit beta [Mycoplasma sp. Pen4]QNM93872.1 phenylalanine--tRNA ligase subunit beta [Mycoplasma sp. Pen4]
MYLSLNHLNTYFKNRKVSAEEVSNALNALGLEVEEIKQFSDVKGLLFAEVLKVCDNPKQPRLDIVEIKTKDGNKTIQTNNKVLKPGDITICFPVGASKGDMVFGAVELQGHISEGMFASWSEIGYDWTLLSEKDQVLVLPNGFATINDDPMQKLGLDDTIIEISTTANRNDANSYYVIAQEIAAYYGDLGLAFHIKDTKSTFNSDVKATNGIAKALTFTEIKGKKASTLEDKMLLAKHGIDAKFDWAVNLTNLTLLNIGVPAHVYDRTKIANNLTTSTYTGKLTILGEKEVELNNVLVVNDDKEPISIACAMGLEKSKTTLETNDYLFEVGVFDHSQVRHSAKELKMISNSASQGSRVITPQLANLAMQYIRMNAEGLEISQIINPVDYRSHKKIAFDASKLQKYTNSHDITKFDEAKSQLSNLGYIFENDYVLVPNYRYDVNIFEDIIEELFRYYSYDKFEPQAVKSVPLITQNRDISKNLIQAQGYSEARTFTLVSREKAQLNPFNFANDINLMTFVSKERETIRNSIITSLSEVVEYNQKRKITNINIFEKGMINNNVLVYGFATTTKDFYALKQDILNFTKLDLEFIPFKDNEFIHPNVSAKILYDGEMIGWIGKLHPGYDQTDAFYAEILVKNIEPVITFEAIDSEPLKTIDLTFELDKKDYIADKINKIKATAKVFDIQQIDDYHKETTHNVTLRVTATSDNIELIDKEFNK